MSLAPAAPWFEDLRTGLEFPAPGLTLTEGLAGLHQAAFGDHLRLPLDHHLCREVTGHSQVLAHPMLVCNVAIGQSTWASQRVLGNLFYRRLLLHRPVFLGDTLRSRTRVAARRRNRPRPGRPASGMVVLEIDVRNQLDEVILHFWRCPMVPCRDPLADADCSDELQAFPELDEAQLLAAVPDWALPRMLQQGPAFADLKPGDELLTEAVDTVTLAPETVRATLNMAKTHLDAGASVYGRRLVYGGHTISMAAAQLSRALPNLATHLAWQHCNHLAPVFEGDRLQVKARVLDLRPLAEGGLLRLQLSCLALREEGEKEVLDWDFWALSA